MTTYFQKRHIFLHIGKTFTFLTSIFYLFVCLFLLQWSIWTQSLHTPENLQHVFGPSGSPWVYRNWWLFQYVYWSKASRVKKGRKMPEIHSATLPESIQTFFCDSIQFGLMQSVFSLCDHLTSCVLVCFRFVDSIRPGFPLAEWVVWKCVHHGTIPRQAFFV